MANQEELIKLISEVSINYPSVRIDSEKIANLWLKMFHAVPVEVLIMATTKHMTESEFFPSVASIFKFIDVACNENAAWEAAYDYALTKKDHNNPGIGLSVVPENDVVYEFDDGLVKETLLHVTWEFIAYSSEKNLPFVRKEFLEKYNEVAHRYNVARRGKLIRGDASVLDRPVSSETPLKAPRSRVMEIMASGTPREVNGPENASEGDSEQSSVYSEEVDIDILNGSRIVSANEIL